MYSDYHIQPGETLQDQVLTTGDGISTEIKRLPDDCIYCYRVTTSHPDLHLQPMSFHATRKAADQAAINQAKELAAVLRDAGLVEYTTI